MLFDLLDFAVFGPLLDDGADFGLGDLAFGLLNSQQAGHGGGAFCEEPDEGRSDCGEESHGSGDDLCGAFGGIHADPFGNEFSEDDGQIGDDDDDGDLGDDGCGPDGDAECGELRTELGGEGIAGVDTGKDSDQGDSDLDGGEESVGVFREFECFSGTFASLPGLHFEV